MTRNDLIEIVAEDAELVHIDAETAVNAMLQAIHNALAKGERVQLTGFGTFEVKDRPARVCRNPRTGEKVQVAATKVPAFKPGKALKEAVKQ